MKNSVSIIFIMIWFGLCPTPVSAQTNELNFDSWESMLPGTSKEYQLQTPFSSVSSLFENNILRSDFINDPNDDDSTLGGVTLAEAPVDASPALLVILTILYSLLLFGRRKMDPDRSF